MVIVCYMTVEGVEARMENERKYRIIERLVQEHKNERVIVMGDMNGHISILGEVNRNGQLLLDFAEVNELEILNATVAEGKVTWSDRQSESVIDYMVVNDRARECVKNMWVDEERVVDVASDHNILILEYECEKQRVNENVEKKRRWKIREADWDRFREVIGDIEWKTGLSGPQAERGVDECNKDLIRKLTRAAEDTIGRTKPRDNVRGSKRKSWWNSEIDQARKERRQLNRKCRRLKRNRENSEEQRREYDRVWEEYRNKQREVKRLIRKAKGDEEREKVKELREMGEEGGKEWYKFMRGEEGRKMERVEELIVNDRRVRKRREKIKVVEEYWKDIGGVNEPDRAIGNTTLGKKIEEGMDEEISMDEIERYVRKLKRGKAPGRDGIPNEFYREGGQGVIEGLHDLFGKIWREERVPAVWNESRVTLIHKGGRKSRKEIRNYRPIAVCDTVCKIFCGVLNERLSEVIERNKVMGEEQNGFRKDRRGEDNMFVVNEVIGRARKDGRKKYLAFLDIEKAYDRVDRRMLCKVLDEVGVSGKIVRIIRSMYENTRAVFSMGDLETGWVSSKRGVRQGCVLSPLLFGLYVEEMAARVRQTGLGVKVGDDVLSILLYADDVVVLSEHHAELQEMLNAVTEYGRDFDVRFSREKSKVLVVNGDASDRDRTWMLGGNEIGRTEEYKYLGIWLDERGCEKTKQDRIARTNQWVGRLGSVARCRANKYEVVRGLWKGVAVPSIMYGLETTVWSKKDMNRLEVLQNMTGRIALGANRYVAVEAIRGDMGWSTFRERLAKAVLRYRVRLQRMDEGKWAKKVYEWNVYGRWAQESYNVELWVGELGMLVRGVIRHGSVDASKREINRRVKEKGRAEWRRGMSEKRTLEWYRGKDRPRSESFYDGSHGGDLLFRARTKSLEVNSRVYRWKNGGSKVCEVCERGVDETVEHFLLECEGYGDARDRMCGVVIEEIGVEVWNQMRERNNGGLTEYLLGLCVEGERNGQVIEAVKDFLESAWRERMRRTERRGPLREREGGQHA